MGRDNPNGGTPRGALDVGMAEPVKPKLMTEVLFINRLPSVRLGMTPSVEGTTVFKWTSAISWIKACGWFDERECAVPHRWRIVQLAQC